MASRIVQTFEPGFVLRAPSRIGCSRTRRKFVRGSNVCATRNAVREGRGLMKSTIPGCTSRLPQEKSTYKSLTKHNMCYRYEKQLQCKVLSSPTPQNPQVQL
eukprot:686179-Rhodomonas_salina.3